MILLKCLYRKWVTCVGESCVSALNGTSYNYVLSLFLTSWQHTIRHWYQDHSVMNTVGNTVQKSVMFPWLKDTLITTKFIVIRQGFIGGYLTFFAFQKLKM